MRILFVTNFYPPHALGGQGHSCQQVVEGLQKRGHQTLVLTSRHGVSREPMADAATAHEPPDANGVAHINAVARNLYLEMELSPWRHAATFFTDRKRREQHNLDSFQRCLQTFDPHAVFVWGMWNLPRSFPAYVEQQAAQRTLYRFADYWPLLPSQHELYWQQPGRKWFSRIPKKIIGRVALGILAREFRDYRFQFKNAYCVSSATRETLVQGGARLNHARVIHTGLDPRPFLSANGDGPRRATPDTHVLYAGRLEATKGIDTIVSAMARLQAQETPAPVRLSIAGSGSRQYEANLRELVFRQELNHCVRFLGQVPQDEMPGLLHDTDIVVVPSRWPEPFARVVLEGMAANAVVLATHVGGSAEIIEDGHNGLLFSPDDSDELAQKIQALIADPQRRAELAQNGHHTVMENFTFERMLDEIEAFLQEIVEAQA